MVVLPVQCLVSVVAIILRPRFQDHFIFEKPKGTVVEGEEEEDLGEPNAD